MTIAEYDVEIARLADAIGRLAFGTDEEGEQAMSLHRTRCRLIEERRVKANHSAFASR